MINKEKFLFRYRRIKIGLVAQLLDYFVHRTLARHDVKVVAVTGSIGKTSAKVAISQLLATRNTVYIEDSNHNSDRTIRLNFFGLPFPAGNRALIVWIPVMWQVYKRSQNFPYDVVVLEMAESRHASLTPFIKALKPTLGVVTGVSPVHLKYFKTYERMVSAVWNLASLCDKVIYNADFDDLKLQVNAGQASTYGITHGSVRMKGIKSGKNGLLQATLVIGKESAQIQTSMVARQSLYAIAAAASVAHELGWTMKQIVSGLKAVQPVKGRMKPLVASNGALLLDDSFNASPTAVFAALRTLGSYKGHKIAVLGSMNELSESAASAHQKVGIAAASVADELIVVGEVASKYLAPAAVKAGMDPAKVHSFDKANQAGDCLRRVIQSDSTVLFKGSQGDIYIEEAIKFVMKHPELASETLVRQGGSWSRRKVGFFAELTGEVKPS